MLEELKFLGVDLQLYGFGQYCLQSIIKSIKDRVFIQIKQINMDRHFSESISHNCTQQLSSEPSFN